MMVLRVLKLVFKTSRMIAFCFFYFSFTFCCPLSYHLPVLPYLSGLLKINLRMIALLYLQVWSWIWDVLPRLWQHQDVGCISMQGQCCRNRRAHSLDYMNLLCITALGQRVNVLLWHTCFTSGCETYQAHPNTHMCPQRWQQSIIMFSDFHFHKLLFFSLKHFLIYVVSMLSHFFYLWNSIC